jgi:hypothetical protein
VAASEAESVPNDRPFTSHCIISIVRHNISSIPQTLEQC